MSMWATMRMDRPIIVQRVLSASSPAEPGTRCSLSGSCPRIAQRSWAFRRRGPADSAVRPALHLGAHAGSPAPDARCSVAEIIGRQIIVRCLNMCRLLIIAMVSVVFCSSTTIAQTKQVREYVSREHKIAISFPTSWKLDSPVRNEVWLASGTVKGISAGCFVRVSSVQNLRLVKPDDFFDKIDEKAFVKLNSIATPDI